MARRIGNYDRETSTPAMNKIYDFLNAELPDYITAGYSLAVNGREYDVVLLVPHLGVFLLEIKGGRLQYADGQYLLVSPSGHVRRFEPLRTRKAKKDFLQYLFDTFHVSPFVYEINCFPKISRADGLPIDPELEDHFMTAEDFKDGQAFMTKIYRYYLARGYMTDSAHTEPDRPYYDDLDDEMVMYITSYWTRKPPAIPRPETPPKAFLSYSSKNGKDAKRVQAELEKAGVFTWKAPMDVPCGENYKPHETEAIEECDAFVFLLTASSQISEEVRYEFDLAKRLGKRIFPIVWGDFEINNYYLDGLREIEWRIVEDDDLSFLDEIVDWLKKVKR